MADGRGKNALSSYYELLSEAEGSEIETVAMDMWAARSSDILHHLSMCLWGPIVAGMGNRSEGVFVKCEGAFGRVLPGRPRGRFFGAVEVGPVGRLADPGPGARRRPVWTGYYLSLFLHRGQMLRAPESHPAVSQTHPLQMKWPRTQVRAPSTAFSFPHLSQVLFDMWSWLLSCRGG